MARNHGARQQKRVAKQKAKRAAKRSFLSERDSKDPTVRLRNAGAWPVARAFVATDLWADGIGHMVLVRQESPGQFVTGVFLVDVYCLGVKNAFWTATGERALKDLIEKIESVQPLRSISPAALVKIVLGAIDYAASFGFRPHPDFWRASMLFEGIDPATCRDQFKFGLDGKPFYFRGPNESAEVARGIGERIQKAGGNFMIGLTDADANNLPRLQQSFEGLFYRDDDDED